MRDFIRPLKIGAVECPSNLILAPMAGITDAPFRILCREGGAGLVCAEMVSANALKVESQKSLKMLRVNAGERPLSMQIFGGDAQTIALAAKLAQQSGADIIDINAGCPVKKVNKAGAGCVLMKEPAKLGQIIAAAVTSVSVPVTLKTRISLTRGEVLGPLLCRIAQDSGAAAVTIHARAAADVHSGPPDLKALEDCCKAVSIPIIGNGGIVDAKSARAAFETGCAGIMIGRAAVGNPFIFSQLAGCAPAGARDKIILFRRLVEENVKLYGQRTGINRSKKTVGYWVRGFENAAALRESLVRAQSLAEVISILSEVCNPKSL
ncbi:MAG: tRNA-dihydrouridine synthase [Elusimicrobiota bacterium]|jgi:nifR3 family TIM-barrel protein|nr:tRNA-dihydrouridine synthase [Elusimicrobiota bacterium]